MARVLIQAFVLAVVVPLVALTVATIRRRLANPEKSWFLCFLNVALYPLQLFRIGPFKSGKLSIDKAMKYAVKKTKLSDFGDMTFLQTYHTFTDCASYNKLQLTPIGYMSYRIELNMTMCRRLMHIDYVKRFPEVTTVAVREPVFVIGMPRTGTTFLHRLLSLDPAGRAPLTWELLSPIPKVSATATQEEMNMDMSKRRTHIKKMLDTRQSMGDHALQHIHEIGYDLPEECLLALTDEIPLLLSLMNTLFFEFDKYRNIPSKDIVRAYRQYKETLQMLAYQVGDRAENTKKWVLKCPAHLFHTKEIVEAFPNAKLIWTHRHPVSCIPSMCSLLKSIHQVYYEPECRDDAMIGRKVKEVYESNLARIGDDVQSSGAAAAHVTYEQLINNPIQVIRDIYEQYNWPFTAEYEQILKEFLAEDARKREETKQKRSANSDVLHSYSPEEFSLTADELSTGAFANYVQRFNIPMSKN